MIEFFKDLIKKLFGTPPEHTEEKKKHKVVVLPEFNITQYAKKLGVSAGIIVAAVIAALKAAHVEEVTQPAVLVGALGVVAAAALGTSFVMAIDLAARAYLTGEGAANKQGEEGGEGPAPDGDEDTPKGEKAKLIPVPAGTVVWLEEEEEPRPVLAMAGDGGKISSYLVATGSVVERAAGDKSVRAIDGTPKWHGAGEIRAIRPAKWT